MKKRYSLIFTITAAAVLVGSIAYASKKKLHSKSEPLRQDMSEVDLATRLLDAGKSQQMFIKESFLKKQDDEELKDLTMPETAVIITQSTGQE